MQAGICMPRGGGGNLGEAKGRIVIDNTSARRATQEFVGDLGKAKAAALDFSRALQTMDRAGAGSARPAAGMADTARDMQRATQAAAAYQREQTVLVNSQIRASTATKDYAGALNVVDNELAQAGDGTRRYNDLLTQQARIQAQVERETARSAQAMRANLSTATDSLERVAVPMVAAGVAAGVMGTRFDAELRKINGVAQMSDVELGNLGQRFVELSTDATKTREGATALAAGFYEIQAAGFDLANGGFTVLEVSSKAASAGLTSTDTAGKAITATLNSLGLEADQAGRVADVLFTTYDKGVISFEQLASQIGDVLPAAAATGVGIEELGAGIATLTTDGQQAGKAVTNLNSLLSSVIKPTQEAKQAAKEYGIDLSVAALQSKGLAGFLADLSAKTGGNVEAMARLIGTQEGLSAALSLTKNNGEAFRDNLVAMQNAAGATDRTFQQMGRSVQAQGEIARAKFEALALTVSSALLPAVNRGLDAVNDMVQGFLDLPQDQQQYWIELATNIGLVTVALYGVGKGVQGILAVVDATRALVGVFKTVGSGAANVTGKLAGLVGGGGPLLLITAALATGALAWHKYDQAMQEIVGSLNESSEAMQRAEAAQQAYAEAGTAVEDGTRQLKQELDAAIAAREADIESTTRWAIVRGFATRLMNGETDALKLLIGATVDGSAAAGAASKEHEQAINERAAAVEAGTKADIQSAKAKQEAGLADLAAKKSADDRAETNKRLESTLNDVNAAIDNYARANNLTAAETKALKDQAFEQLGVFDDLRTKTTDLTGAQQELSPELAQVAKQLQEADTAKMAQGFDETSEEAQALVEALQKLGQELQQINQQGSQATQGLVDTQVSYFRNMEAAQSEHNEAIRPMC